MDNTKFMNRYFLTLLVVLFLASCSSDNDGSDRESESSILIKFDNTFGDLLRGDGFLIKQNEATIEEPVTGIKVVNMPIALKSRSGAKVSSESAYSAFAVLPDDGSDPIGFVVNISNGDFASDPANFTGKVRQEVIGDESSFFDLTFENGKLVFVETGDNESGRVADYGTCNSARDVLNCAGRKFESNCCGVEEVLGCYASFLPCLTWRAIDCWIKDCPAQ
jgi:hypothetical protein